MSIESFIADHAVLTPEQMTAKYPLTYTHPASIAGGRIRDEQRSKHIVPPEVLEEAERHGAVAKQLEDRIGDKLVGLRRERTPVMSRTSAAARDMGDQVADILLAQRYGCDSLEEATARGIDIPELRAAKETA